MWGEKPITRARAPADNAYPNDGDGAKGGVFAPTPESELIAVPAVSAVPAVPAVTDSPAENADIAAVPAHAFAALDPFRRSSLTARGNPDSTVVPEKRGLPPFCSTFTVTTADTVNCSIVSSAQTTTDLIDFVSPVIPPAPAPATDSLFAPRPSTGTIPKLGSGAVPVPLNEEDEVDAEIRLLQKKLKLVQLRAEISAAEWRCGPTSVSSPLSAEALHEPFVPLSEPTFDSLPEQPSAQTITKTQRYHLHVSRVHGSADFHGRR